MLGMKPCATGSLTTAKTIGMVDVACFSAAVAGVPFASSTSGARRTSSSAYWLVCVMSPPLQRQSMERLRPSFHPSWLRPSRNAATRPCANGSSAPVAMSTPRRRMRTACSANAAKGRPAMADPTSLMKARRFMRPHASWLLSGHQAYHKAAANDKQIAAEGDLQGTFRHRVGGPHAGRGGQEAGRHHQGGTDQGA